MNKNTICILPWIHVHIAPGGDAYPCSVICDEPSKIGTLNNSTISELQNSEKLKELRLSMLAGQKHSICDTCWKIEDQSLHTSVRQLYNHKFLNTVHNKNFWHLVEQTNEDGSINNPTLKLIDVRFSNVCNLKCRMCKPEQSTFWIKDWIQLNPDKPKPVALITDKNKTLVDQILNNVNEIESIYFAGGEPLLSKEHYEILSGLLTQHKNDTDIVYHTNLSVLTFWKWDVLELWKQFTNIHVGVSIDSFEERNDFIRSGSKWDHIVTNLKKVQELPNVEVTTNTVISMFNILNIPDVMDTLLSLNVNPDKIQTTILQIPIDQKITNLPKDVKQKVTKEINEYASKFTGQFHNNLMSIIQFMNSQDDEYLLDFFYQSSRLDNIRNENMLTTFPELMELKNAYF